jgi:putative addiction module component (TIGR02574 family)
MNNMETKELLALPLAKRLEVMEALWDSLSHDDSGVYVSPEWHETVLQRRAEALDSGLETTSAWTEAKVRIRKVTGTG